MDCWFSVWAVRQPAAVVEVEGAVAVAVALEGAGVEMAEVELDFEQIFLVEFHGLLASFLALKEQCFQLCYCRLKKFYEKICFCLLHLSLKRF